MTNTEKLAQIATDIDKRVQALSAKVQGIIELRNEAMANSDWHVAYGLEPYLIRAHNEERAAVEEYQTAMIDWMNSW